jgi:hypothetical protein
MNSTFYKEHVVEFLHHHVGYGMLQQVVIYPMRSCEYQHVMRESFAYSFITTRVLMLYSRRDEFDSFSVFCWHSSDLEIPVVL